ncbi:MAG TPA: hypothetical protein VGK47_11465 [Nitrososphaeraceae archaeon]
MTTPTGQGPMGRTGSKVPSGYKQFQIQKFTPEQQELFSQLFSNVSPDSYLGKLAAGDQSEFQAMEAPALRQFSELQGNLSSRFSGMGTGGRKSSGFQNTMNQAASDFAQDLQSKRMQTRMDAIKELMGFSNQLLQQQPYETGLVQKPPSGWQQFASSIGGAIPGAVTSAFTGGFGGGAAPAAGGMTSAGSINPSMF